MTEAEATGDRFARARLIDGWDQNRLAGATAVVAGVGALGNEVAKNLALDRT
jgi:molybdopterin/thiamine biosynthesis adenylyltransferase